MYRAAHISFNQISDEGHDTITMIHTPLTILWCTSFAFSKVLKTSLNARYAQFGELPLLDYEDDNLKTRPVNLDAVNYAKVLVNLGEFRDQMGKILLNCLINLFK